MKFNIFNLILGTLYLAYLIFKFIRDSKKPRAWGVVYNSKTMIPIPSAFVKLYEYGSYKLIDTKVTNKLGMFQFFVPNAKYALLVAASGYKFPSKHIDGGDLIYHSSLISVDSEYGGINRDVALDPISQFKDSPFG